MSELHPLKTQPKLNHNSTQPQPNIPLVVLDVKMTLHTTPPPHKLNVSNIISAVTDQILMKV